MNEFVDAFIGDTQELLSVGFIVFLRIGAILAVLPLFGERSIPQRIRLGIAAAFTAIIAPAVYDDVLRALRADPNLVRLLGAEAITGVAFGLAVRMFIFVLQIAGTIAAQSTSLSQIFGTSGLEPLPAIGHLLVVGGLALAAISGLHVQVVNAVIGTYDVIPPGVLPSPSVFADWGVARVSQAFAFAFTLAAPFVIASFIYNLAIGVINKAMPQLMVAFVGAPAITAGGLVLLALSMPTALSVWNESLRSFLAAPFGV